MLRAVEGVFEKIYEQDIGEEGHEHRPAICPQIDHSRAERVNYENPNHSRKRPEQVKHRESHNGIADIESDFLSRFVLGFAER
jgi:hypothetical protein